METLKSYNLKDENKTISNIFNFKLYIPKKLPLIIMMMIMIMTMTIMIIMIIMI